MPDDIHPSDWERSPRPARVLRGAVLCWAGKHADAVEALSKLFRAVAEYDRGDDAAARPDLQQAVGEKERVKASDPKAAVLPMPWGWQAEIAVLQREVEALLPPDGKLKPGW